jgi:hypothetical protein
MKHGPNRLFDVDAQVRPPLRESNFLCAGQLRWLARKGVAMKSLRGPYLVWRLLVFGGGLLVTVALAYFALRTIRLAVEYGYLSMPAWRNEIASGIVWTFISGLLSFASLRARGRFAAFYLSVATMGIVGFGLIVAARATMNTH